MDTAILIFTGFTRLIKDEGITTLGSQICLVFSIIQVECNICKMNLWAKKSQRLFKK